MMKIEVGKAQAEIYKGNTNKFWTCGVAPPNNVHEGHGIMGSRDHRLLNLLYDNRTEGR